MNKLVASVVLGATALVSTAAMAADPVTYDYPVYKDYVPPYIPPVDEGLKGSFYLRGSAAGHIAWAAGEVTHVGADDVDVSITDPGWGYSWGVGAGYETGDGWRFDVTVDRLASEGMTANVPAGTALQPGDHSLSLRSTIGLANVYYDFGLSDMGLSAAGGLFAYVGAGVGAAYNDYIWTSTPPGGNPDTVGSNLTWAAAAMTGVGMDWGALVGDLGYRALYLNKVENTQTTYPYQIDHMLVHEIRATLRYRF
ncbi:outer membrane protein [Pelagibacterium sp.]|uniref:outer membrane protein n=1 Tax=Pelagibacterium sp. TaxID=1967288 RepID=UPI003A90B937